MFRKGAPMPGIGRVIEIRLSHSKQLRLSLLQCSVGCNA
jgi:hypothetical protein